jgi:hypothetical protein
MINNRYFHNLKKTGPPVETERPLRLLDMRLFNCLCCADTTAYNGITLNDYLPQLLHVLLVTHLFNKLTLLRQVKPINL